MQDAVRGTQLGSLPPVLQLQFVRFAYDRRTQRLGKLNNKFAFYRGTVHECRLVACPNAFADMDLRHALPEGLSAQLSEEEYQYTLFAVLVHTGGMPSCPTAITF